MDIYEINNWKDLEESIEYFNSNKLRNVKMIGYPLVTEYGYNFETSLFECVGCLLLEDFHIVDFHARCFDSDSEKFMHHMSANTLSEKVALYGDLYDFVNSHEIFPNQIEKIVRDFRMN